MLLVGLSLPLLVPAALLLSMHSAMRGVARTVAFIFCYLCCEAAGIVVSAWLWVVYRAPQRDDHRWPAYLDANHKLQCAWAAALKRAAEYLFDLHFDVRGIEALRGDGAIMMARHASMADTVIPMVFYAIPNRIRLRYVLKKELLFDPCLDIVGNRLPNCFVDRHAEDGPAEATRVADLLTDLAPDEGILIFPEGTRFLPERRARVLERLAAITPADEMARMRAWTDLLPPRRGGPLALLRNNPGRDLVFCAHTGFEGSTHFRNLANGAWTGARIRIRFWRIAHGDIPTVQDAQARFLFAQWDRMQETVSDLKGMEDTDGQERVLP